MRTPALLAILDGVGIADPAVTNAVTSANAPFLHELFSDTVWPCRSLGASGKDVGLPDGQMGNSEVGHLNIGAGRIVNQELNRIDKAIEDGSLLENDVLCETFDEAAHTGAAVHFMGLLSDGGVHSMQDHLEALLTMAADRGVKRIRIAAFLDGRDVLPSSGAGYVRRADDFCRVLQEKHPDSDIRISMISGRYYAMDRDNRWERVERTWTALVTPSAETVRCVPQNTDPVTVVGESYAAGITDEFVEPVAIGDAAVCDGDAIVFFNFRPDRARELTRAFIDPGFSDFARPLIPDVAYVCMTEYDPSFEADFSARVVFPKSFPENVLADYLSSLGLRQLHIAETEKYAHVTFFLNGGIEAAKEGEQRILIASPQVATYDLKPEMSAPEVTDALVKAINENAADVYIVNYANGDMVGHTGVLPAAVSAVEAVDKGLRRVIDAIIDKGGVALVTADHGNSEQMVDEQGNVWTAHTVNEVPLVLIAPPMGGSETGEIDLDKTGVARLADIAPTLVDVMGLEIPEQWTGRSLLERS
ncbi:MAG TPA: 2,3-bisphosphoglycerate-independent phosphoglycerate mutase [Coriobacteriia bacterium]|nr:2,3-bisphosphoglycerate-independent phosphoglycerate mutase [Coriobacteriia bacterium]